MNSSSPVDCALAIDVLRKLAEEGVRVTLRYSENDSMFHVDLSEGKLSEPLDAEYWGVDLVDTIESALHGFRMDWASDVPPQPPEGPPNEVVSESGKLKS